MSVQKEMSGVKGPGKFCALQCDVANDKEVVETFDYIKKNFKTLHILVNNAGILTMKSTDGRLIFSIYCSKLV